MNEQYGKFKTGKLVYCEDESFTGVLDNIETIDFMPKFVVKGKHELRVFCYGDINPVLDLNQHIKNQLDNVLKMELPEVNNIEVNNLVSIFKSLDQRKIEYAENKVLYFKQFPGEIKSSEIEGKYPVKIPELKSERDYNIHATKKAIEKAFYSSEEGIKKLRLVTDLRINIIDRADNSLVLNLDGYGKDKLGLLFDEVELGKILEFEKKEIPQIKSSIKNKVVGIDI